jgi:hypothetical protein
MFKTLTQGKGPAAKPGLFLVLSGTPTYYLIMSTSALIMAL